MRGLISRWDRVVPLLLGAWLLLGPFVPELEANADTERDLFRTWALGAYGEWPDKGPRLDHSPLSLGPGWYLTTAPVLVLTDGSVFAVHVWHVLTFLVGLALLQAAMASWLGRAVALAVSLALLTSNFVAQVMVRVWHPAQLPGVACLWFACALWVVRAGSPQRRAAALGGGWLLLPWMLQLHLVSAAYLAVQGLLSIDLLVRDRLQARGWLAAAFGVCVVLVGGYVMALADVDLEELATLSDARLDAESPVWMALSALPEFFVSAWATPTLRPLGAVYAAVTLAGGVLAASRLRRRDDPSRWVLLQVVIGFAAVVSLARLAAQARYFSGVMPGLFVLFGVGLSAIAERLPSTRQFGIPAAVAALAFIGGWFVWPTPDVTIVDRPAAPTLVEQEAIVAFGRSHGLAGHRLESRLHGPVYGGLTALRWVDYIAEPPSASALDRRSDLFVAPRGFPGTPPLETEEVRVLGPGRELTVGTLVRRVGRVSVHVDRPCPIALPYRWGSLTAAEYREFDIVRGLDIERCRTRPEAPLTLRLEGVRSDSLFLLLSWFDVARGYPARAEVHAEGARVERVRGAMLDHLALFRIVVDRPNPTLVITPLDTIASVDLY